ncbi:phosphotransferase [Chroococcidiopsis sp.]|uniref:phosphotransferase n=1 Tax=Chroococcidiopsis sp. TaxID=3088168 RepID=UPI003F33EDB9
MQVLLPYGEDALVELEDNYGLNSIEAVEKVIIHHLQRQYSFQVVSIEELQICTGMAAKLRADDEIYYLKFSSHEIHKAPDQLFPWLDYARKQGIPLPEIIPATNGCWYLSPLQDSDYDVVYLMREVPGKPIEQVSKPVLSQFAEAMAQFHRIGFNYSQPVQGDDYATWADVKQQENLDELRNDLQDRPFISQELVTEAMQVIEDIPVCTMPQTMIHGDFRFCHVFFEDNTLSGIIDMDESTQGERLLDLCYGLASGSAPEEGSLLTFEQLQDTLLIYDRSLPLNEQERSTLKGMFAYMFLATLCHLSYSNGTEQGINVTQELLRSILSTSEQGLLRRV